MSSNSEWPGDSGSVSPAAPVIQRAPATGENPPWGGWDVLAIVFSYIFLLLLSLLIVTAIAKRTAFPSIPFMQVMSFPLVSLAAQIAAYGAALGIMFIVATHRSSETFWGAIQWRWPRLWPLYVLIGVLSCIILQFLARFLPMPKEAAMEVFFATPLRAWVLSIVGTTFGPLMEELFFRGFLYPVLARRLGLVLAVALTTVAFASIHIPQLADPHMPLATSWGPILIIFLIGLALTIIRAIKKSVAAGLLVHMGYNGFTSLLAIIATGGFRHLEKIGH